MNLSSIRIIILIFSWIGLAPLLSAQETPGCVLHWSLFDGGGGTAAGGDFSVASSVGRPEAGASHGGDFAVAGAFGVIQAVTELPPPPVAVTLQVSVENGAVVISWPGDGTERILLEETTALEDESSWVLVDATPQSDATTSRVRVSLSAGHRFYRLRKP